MADVKITALAAQTGAGMAAGDLLPIVDVSDTSMAASGTDKSLAASELLAYLQANGLPKLAALTSDVSSSSTTGAAVAALTMATGTGRFIFQYFLRYQQAATTTGIKFGINHTGTITALAATMRYAATGTAATSSTATQNSPATGVSTIHEDASTRTKSTTAPNMSTLGADAATSDLLIVVEGVIEVTVDGNLELWHASRTAASASVIKPGSALMLTKVA